MKKIFSALCVAFSILLFAACSSNSGIKAGKEFLKNPTIGNFKAYTAEVANLDDEEKVELEAWAEDNKAELEQALLELLGGK